MYLLWLCLDTAKKQWSVEFALSGRLGIKAKGDSYALKKLQHALDDNMSYSLAHTPFFAPENILSVIVPFLPHFQLYL